MGLGVWGFGGESGFLEREGGGVGGKKGNEKKGME